MGSLDVPDEGGAGAPRGAGGSGGGGEPRGGEGTRVLTCRPRRLSRPRGRCTSRRVPTIGACGAPPVAELLPDAFEPPIALVFWNKDWKSINIRSGGGGAASTRNMRCRQWMMEVVWEKSTRSIRRSVNKHSDRKPCRLICLMLSLSRARSFSNIGCRRYNLHLKASSKFPSSKWFNHGIRAKCERLSSSLTRWVPHL